MGDEPKHNPILTQHTFAYEDVRKYPDLSLQFMIRELVVRATDNNYDDTLNLDQAIAILQTELDYLNSQVKKATHAA